MVFPREQLVVHHIDTAESNRQALAYQQKRIEDHAYMMAALKDD
jgi:hypothetical protein